MEFCSTGKISTKKHWLPENIVEIDQHSILSITEKICKEGRYPQLALRIFMHLIAGIDTKGKAHISARHLSKKLDVHYDTVTKCLKYLREIGAVALEKDKEINTTIVYGKKAYCVHSLTARKTANKKVPDYAD